MSTNKVGRTIGIETILHNGMQNQAFVESSILKFSIHDKLETLW